jgi:hypothetical protein
VGTDRVIGQPTCSFCQKQIERCVTLRLFEKKVFPTAKSQRTQRELFLFNPVRGGIEQTNPGLRPNNYPEGSEGY